jgi:hypothetical protein
MFPFVCEARNLYSRDETRLCNVEASLVGPDYLIPIINSGAQRYRKALCLDYMHGSVSSRSRVVSVSSKRLFATWEVLDAPS